MSKTVAEKAPGKLSPQEKKLQELLRRAARIAKDRRKSK
jgi:hypothetical protein